MALPVRSRQRVHRWFVAIVFVLGAAAIADALRDLNAAPAAYQWGLLAILTLASGAFAVKVPALNATLSISETFIFALVLLFGGAPAVVTVAIDGLTVSLIRRHRQLRHVAFNLAEPAVSMWVASKVYYALAGVPPLSVQPATLADVGLPAIALSGTYFLMNSVLNALAMATESGTSPLALWRKYFLWVSLNYFGGASIAVLAAVNTHGLSLSSLLAIAPLILISYFTFKSSMGRLEDENVHLAEVNRLYLKVVETLAMAVDAKDQVTHGHIRRVQTFALRLAKKLKVTNPDEIKAIEAAALLHDMGKLAVPEHILNKPGRLTEAEYDRMKLHAPLGADMLSAVGFPYPVVPIVRHHHENWDGTGYPDALRGDAIPIGARILSVVDCYDALRSHRPYRRALSPEQALEIVRERRGTMYDPAVVDAFDAIRAEIEAESVDEPLPEVLDRFAKAAREMHSQEADQQPLSLEFRLHTTTILLRLHDELSKLAADAPCAATCDAVTRSLRQLAPADLVVIYQRDDATEELSVACASGFGESLVGGLTMPMGHGVSGWAAANQRPVLNADPALDGGARFAELTPALRSVLSVPLVSNRSVVGAVALYSVQASAFTVEQRQAVELVADSVAGPLVAVLAKGGPGRESAATAATASSIENLLQRGSFWGASSGRTLGLLYLSTEGNRDAMAHVSVAVNQATRIADLIFRLENDDLVVLMPDCDQGAWQAVSDRILEALERLPQGAAAMAALRLGFACGPHDGASLRDLLGVARDHARAEPLSPGILVPALEATNRGTAWRS